MPTITDEQFSQLRTVMDGLEPVTNKLSTGDTSLTGDEIGRYNDAVSMWRTMLDNVG